MLNCIVIIILGFQCVKGFEVIDRDLGIFESNINFIALGDWGGSSKPPYKTIEQELVSDQMSNYSKNHDVAFVLSLGDNFYPFGITKGQENIRFKRSFEDVYLKNSFKNIPWYVIAGNHDHRTKNSVQKQIDYSMKSSVWNFPDYLYKITFHIQQAGKQKLVTMVMIDTVLLCNLFDQNFSNKLNSDYYEKLFQKLKSVEGKSDLLFLVGHHPVYTTMRGRKHSSCLHKHLMILMKSFSVNGYIGGHDHTLQYHKYLTINQEINFFISGAGQGTYKRKHTPNKQLMNFFHTEFYWSRVEVEAAKDYEKNKSASGGFLTLEIGFEHYNATFLNSHGNVLFKKTIEF